MIEPSTSAWLTPIALVNKPDGDKKIFLEYRRVNSQLVDVYPLPRLDELGEKAAGQEYYTSLEYYTL